MSSTSLPQPRYRRALAVALAAGLAFGTVQAVPGAAPYFTPTAQAAEVTDTVLTDAWVTDNYHVGDSMVTTERTEPV